MAWTTPILVEICIGLEINGYLPAEFWSDWRLPSAGRCFATAGALLARLSLCRALCRRLSAGRVKLPNSLH